VGDPTLFHGKKEELFLAGLGVIFTLQASLFSSDRDKIMHAFNFIRGPPRNALTPAIIDQRVWDVTNWTRSYMTFTDYLKKNYGDPNERQTAIDKINSLRQQVNSLLPSRNTPVPLIGLTKYLLRRPEGNSAASSSPRTITQWISTASRSNASG